MEKLHFATINDDARKYERGNTIACKCGATRHFLIRGQPGRLYVQCDACNEEYEINDFLQVK